MAISKEDAVARQKAIDAGKTTYVRPSDGIHYKIRNLKNKRYKNLYGGQGGRDENAGSRKANRGGGSQGSRKQNERLVTPDKTQRYQADKAMGKMAAKGNVGHHKFPVSYLANGEKQKPGTVAAYERVHGANNIGHKPDALMELDHKTHNKIHNVEEPRMYNGVKNAKGSFRGLVFNNGSVSMSYGLNMIAEYLPAIDEITGGHVDVAIQNGVNGIRNGLGLKPNPVTRITPESQMAQINRDIARSQEAIKNGGTMKLGPITLPEFGVSELIGL
tara:strand:- start:271 stop:1092 length:822 start_codon:yes stop_codon:yes gene_type:complete